MATPVVVHALATNATSSACATIADRTGRESVYAPQQLPIPTAFDMVEGRIEFLQVFAVRRARRWLVFAAIEPAWRRPPPGATQDVLQSLVLDSYIDFSEFHPDVQHVFYWASRSRHDGGHYIALPFLTRILYRSLPDPTWRVLAETRVDDAMMPLFPPDGIPPQRPQLPVLPLGPSVDRLRVDVPFEPNGHTTHHFIHHSRLYLAIERHDSGANTLTVYTYLATSEGVEAAETILTHMPTIPQASLAGPLYEAREAADPNGPPRTPPAAHITEPPGSYTVVLFNPATVVHP